MSIFDQNNPKENSEELLYQAIKEELEPILRNWDDKVGRENTGGLYFQDPQRMRLIKDTSKIVMQFIWMKLGMKLPDYTRRILDSEYNLMGLKVDK